MFPIRLLSCRGNSSVFTIHNFHDTVTDPKVIFVSWALLEETRFPFSCTSLPSRRTTRSRKMIFLFFCILHKTKQFFDFSSLALLLFSVWRRFFASAFRLVLLPRFDFSLLALVCCPVVGAKSVRRLFSLVITAPTRVSLESAFPSRSSTANRFRVARPSSSAFELSWNGTK